MNGMNKRERRGDTIRAEMEESKINSTWTEEVVCG